MKRQIEGAPHGRSSPGNPGDLDFLHRMLGSLSAKLEGELQTRTRRRVVLADSRQGVEVSRVFDWITRTCHHAFDCDRVILAVQDPGSDELVVRSTAGGRVAGQAVGTRYKRGENIIGWVAQRRELLVLGPRVRPGEDGEVQTGVHALTAALVAPLSVGDELLGVIQVSSQTGGFRYSLDDLRSLRFFTTVAAGILRQALEIERIQGEIQEFEARLGKGTADVRQAA